MSKTLVSSLFSQSSKSRKLQEHIALTQEKITLSGLAGSSFSLLILQTFKNAELPFLVILEDKEEAAYFHKGFW